MKGNSFRTGLFILVLLFAFSLQDWAQGISAKAVFDTNTIQLGNQVSLRISLEKPLDVPVLFPVFRDSLFDPSIEIINKSKLDTSRLKNNNILISQTLTLAVFDTGLFYIPPIEFVSRQEPFTDTFRSNANYLEVLSFPVDSTNTIRDIKGLYKAPLGFREILPYALILVFIGLLVWLVIIYHRRRKRNEPFIFRSKPVDPADVIALRALDELKEQKLWQQGKVKEYYSVLTDIIREYIEKRFGILAPEQTSYEILSSIENILPQDESIAFLRNLLPLADLVKFAKANPEPDENVHHLEKAYEFIRNTRHQATDENRMNTSNPEVETVNMGS